MPRSNANPAPTCAPSWPCPETMNAAAPERLSCHIRSSSAPAPTRDAGYMSIRVSGGRPASPVDDGATCAEIVVASNVAEGGGN